MGSAHDDVRAGVMIDQQTLDFNSGADTSRDAANDNRPRAQQHRELALAALTEAGERGLTDFELEDVVGVKQTSIGVRRGELKKAGLVARRLVIDPKTLELVGDRRPAPSGSTAAVWSLTEWSTPQ